VRVELEGVAVAFARKGPRALDGVDLVVEEGEQVALLGPSGSGKTTLLRVLVGAVRPAAGRVRVGGLDPAGPAAELRRLRRGTGVVWQRDDLVAGVSARLNVVMATTPEWRVRDWVTALRGGVPDGYAARLASLCRGHGIEACLPARVEQLSGGQRRRVALVRALLPGPRLLLADEPNTGLDPPAAAAAVEALRAADATTLVLCTHDLGVARRFPRTVALRAGRVAYDGPPPDAREVERIYGPPGGG
jgi:ABC-type phosphate/phosphonate transport system ATPase subunit